MFVISIVVLSVPTSTTPLCVVGLRICDCSVREFMNFTSDLLVERTDVGARQSVKEQGEWRERIEGVCV